uniref:Phosphatidic acid phosphatase type 2/haloperoxidase domain-containing protein n=1 Tax=Globisporangium ultimum (strain ATCC 200006 / CBS 805.95 / DAOM BR144) TaxID=431595 RepID=K3WYP2_GLOUD
MASPPQPSSSASDRRGGGNQHEWTAFSEEDDPRIIHEKSAWKRFVLRYRVSEFACTAVMFGFSLFFSLIDVHERPIPSVEVRLSVNSTVYSRDPSINYKKMDEQVPMPFLIGAGCAVPVVTNLFVNYVLPKFKRVRVIPHDTRDFLLSLFQSAGLASLLTQFIKNMTGRFRPCFYDMCGWQKDIIWDGVANLCTSAKWEKEARKSFPSGHSSFAWSTMLVLTLYLLGRSRLNCENRSASIMRGGRKSLKLFVCFVPSFFAAWVAVTRSIDNWHHYTDIVTGSIIGAVAAVIGYGYNYGSVFSSDSAGVPYQEYHNRRKRKDRDFLEASSSLEESHVPTGVLHSQPNGLLHKPAVVGYGEHVINVNPRNSASSATQKP